MYVRERRSSAKFESGGSGGSRVVAEGWEARVGKGARVGKRWNEKQ